MIKNTIIAVILTIGCIMVYKNLAPPPEHRLDAILGLSLFWLISFFFMGSFASIIGITIKSLILIAIGGGIIYGASFMPDLAPRIVMTILGAGIALVSLITPIDIYFSRKREKELEENGIEIEAILDEVVKVRRHKDYHYFKTHWTDPESGDVHSFKSHEFLYFDEDSIKTADAVKVRVNKNNVKHYKVDVEPFRTIPVNLMDTLLDKICKK